MARGNRKTSPPPGGKTAAADVDKMLTMLQSGGDVRRRKVRRLRAAVRADRYENDLKLAIAADRLLGDLSPQPRGPRPPAHPSPSFPAR